ncbi:MAG: nitrite reductase/ring-hydroxylating ferredoxin subunit [Candidatus Poriferisodalaceae bacterium]|jgi:nitrite reductase/ring-hydroxylating ferredoxin subunit
MSRHGISSELLDQIEGPIEQACSLPNHACTSEEFFQWEADSLFASTWLSIGSASHIAKPGAQRPVTWMGIPLAMVRGADEAVGIFHNVCQHRGNELVGSACTSSLMQCRYHAWTYDLHGSLERTPHVGGHGVNVEPSLNAERLGLSEVRSAVWLDMIFVNLSATAEPFESFIAPLERRVRTLTPLEQFEPWPSNPDGDAHHSSPRHPRRLVLMPHHWVAMAQWVHEVTGNDTVTDPVFEDSAIRAATLELIDSFVEELTMQLTGLEAFQEGQRRGIPITPVNTIAALRSDPHLAASGFWQETELPAGGTVVIPGAPFRTNLDRWRTSRAPRLGEHTGLL